jgi:putative DNA primase/helicase
MSSISQDAAIEYSRPNYTDKGNADRLIQRYGDKLRYVKDWGCWMIWDGRRWVRDAKDQIIELAKDTITAMYGEVGQMQIHLRRPHADIAHRSDGSAE